MAKVTYVLAQGENSAGESQVNFRVYVSRESRVRVPSGIWVDRKRWGKKNDINIPNIPGEERDALLAKRTKLKELVDVIETSVEAADDKSTVTREWLEKLIRRTLRPKTATSVEEKKIGFFPLTDEYLAKFIDPQAESPAAATNTASAAYRPALRPKIRVRSIAAPFFTPAPSPNRPCGP